MSCHDDYKKKVDEIEEMLSRVSDPKSRARLHLEIGLLHSDNEQYDLALASYLQALQLFEELGDKEEISKVYNNMGLVYLRLEQMSKALNCFFDSKKLKETIGSVNNVFYASVLNNIGLVHLCDGNWSEAFKAFYDSSEIIRQVDPEHVNYADALNNMGLACMRMAEYDRALDYFMKAGILYKNRNDSRNLANIHSNMGMVYKEMGHLDVALRYVQKGLSLAVQSDDTLRKREALDLLSTIYAMRNDYQKAYMYLKQYVELMTDVFSESLQKNFVIASALFKTNALHRELLQRRLLEKRLKKEIEFADNLFNFSAACLFVVDRNRRIIRINDTALKLLGKTREDVLGKPCNTIICKNIPCPILDEGKVYDCSEQKMIDHLGRTIPVIKTVFKRETDDDIQLWESFVDIRIQKQVELELRKSRDQLQRQNMELLKLKKAVEQSANTVVITDTEGIIEYVNPKFEEITGYSREEAIGQKTSILKSGKHDESLYRNLWETISFGKVWRGEFCNKRKDGTLYWEMATIAPVIDASGHITNYIAIKEDITHLKQTMKQLEKNLKDREMLLRETHHRIKNNLAIVSGLLSLQAMDVDDEHLLAKLEESQMRINAIATIHEKLYRSRNFKQINFREYIQDLADEILRIHGNPEKDIRLEYEISDIYSIPDTAITCGLIINELVTNALKHAFSDRSGGRIYIGMKLREDDQVEISIRDDGKGFEDKNRFNTAETLGLQLIKNLVDKLEGTLSFETDGGSRFKICFDRKQHKCFYPEELESLEDVIR